MGISKVSGQPLSIAPTVADSHFALVQHLADMDVRVLQQNMPFSRGNLHGAIQLTYAAEGESLLQYLKHSLGLSADSSHYDPLLDYISIDFSAAFFVPSISFLELTVQQASSQLAFE
jgi:putative iron-dependent peroxidase